ncbi:hypothetical protein JZ751_028373 [Albula glossodonta]|uniref:Uncharacterized protein n=1 Tax=Albula glossodonta TaxID=121402 RepID=A0A8T2MPK9_9TELE|nr:hypothetical protein JZ751_028373 [Albula glossodonta]
MHSKRYLAGKAEELLDSGGIAAAPRGMKVKTWLQVLDDRDNPRRGMSDWVMWSPKPCLIGGGGGGGDKWNQADAQQVQLELGQGRRRVWVWTLLGGYGGGVTGAENEPPCSLVLLQLT